MLLSLIFGFFNIQTVLTEISELPPTTLVLNQTRRILRGSQVHDTRPYMVYLRPAHSTTSKLKLSNWLCGGVIIHSQYILTSAACIEDVHHFYIVSGTHRWLPLGEEDECIKNGAKKAIWKCVPKDYVFDGKDFDNIRWMVNDIAVVKVDEEFNFEKRIRGCDFIPKLIAYNNQSEILEAPGSVGSIAGWGSVDRFGDVFARSTMNSPELLETDVILISKKKCKRQWPERYHYIIEENMICAKDGVDSDSINVLCQEQEINCKELIYSDDEEDDGYRARRYMIDANASQIHSSNHKNDTRRSKLISGGFCENDHGGPLVGGHGKSSVVIGVISACMTANITQKCYGPFLYTSVWRNRHIISCAIDKERGASCRKLLRSLRTRIIKTTFTWPSLRIGPSQPKVNISSERNTKIKPRRSTTVNKQTQYYRDSVRGSIDVATTLPPYVHNVLQQTNISKVRSILNGSRRIINAEESRNRPYMVYLKLPSNDPKYTNYRRWLCGGVIVHKEYILTSAACIEDAQHFYIVSGTYKHNEEDDRYSSACVKNGAKKAVWKCIPRNYVFDGHENDNIRWMNNDIAIVKVEDEFDFTRRIRGCDFIPKPICYNNQSSRYEDPGNIAMIAGWGSTDKYTDWIKTRSQPTTQNLLETSVRIVSKNNCKRRWGPRYHNIIDNYMICSRDIIPDLSEPCHEKYVECKDIMYSGEDEGARRVLSPNNLTLHSAYHNESGRRQQLGSGGFCENDHGGPLIYGEGSDAVVIGIISACLVKERTNKCYGPFLYTSVYKNRILINCAIYKNTAGDCTKLFRSSETHREEEMSWINHPDGPAKNEVFKMRRTEEKIIENKTKQLNNTKLPLDNVMKHGGVVLRTFEDHATLRIKSNNATE